MAAGDIGIYRDAASATNFNSATFTGYTFATEVQGEGDFSAGAGAAINMPAGHVLAIYNLGFRRSGGSNRSETDARLNLAGSVSPYGLSSGYIRRSGANDESYQSAGAILDVASAGDDLIVEVSRTDNNLTAIANSIPNVSALQLIELDDTWNYFRAKFSGSSASVAVNTGNPVQLPLASSTDVDFDEAADEKDTGFAHAEATTPEQITCPKELLLVCYGVRFSNSTSRRNAVTWLELDGTRLDHTYASVYVRDQQAIEDGWGSWVGLVDVSGATTGNLVVKAAVETESGSSATTYTDGYLTIAELPSGAAFAHITNSAAHTSFPNATPAQITLDTETELDTGAFSHPTDPELSADNAGDYLYLAGFAYDRTGVDNTRQAPQLRWHLDGTVQTRGQFGNFSRGDQSSTSTYVAAQSGGYILRSEDTGDRDVEVRVLTEETNNQEAGRFQAGLVWLQGLELASLFAGGGAVDLDGTAAAISGSSADAEVSRAIGATVVVASGHSADLGVTRQLSGTASAVSAASANLAPTRALSSAAAAVSAASGSLEVERGLSSTAAALSGSSTALDAGRSLDGTASAVSDATSQLEIARELSGDAAALSGSAADLDVSSQTLFDGAAVAQSGQQADLAASRSLASTAAAISGTTGDLSLARELVGVAPAVSSHQADAEVDRALAGTAAAASVASGELTLQGQVILSGTAVATSGSQAGLLVDRSLDGTAQAVSDASSLIDRQPNLSGAAVAASGSVASVALLRSLIANAPSFSGSAAELDVTSGLTLLSGTAVGASGHQAGLARTVSLNTISQASSDTVAALQRDVTFDAVAAGVSSGFGDLASSITPLTSIDLDGDMSALPGLDGLIVGNIDLVGLAVSNIALAGSA